MARRLAEEFRHAPVVVDGGILAGGGVPKARLGHPSDRFKVMLQTRLQKVTLRTPALVGDTLRGVVLQGSQLLRDVMTPFKFKGWTECYDVNLSPKGGGLDQSWKWNGDLKATGA